MDDATQLPPSATLGPFTYRITADPDEWAISDEDPAKNYGHTDHERGVIIVHARTTDSMRRVVLMHELMHAAIFAAGQIRNRKRHEEEWVISTAPLLLDALRRSPELTAYLLDKAEGAPRLPAGCAAGCRALRTADRAGYGWIDLDILLADTRVLPPEVTP